MVRPEKTALESLAFLVGVAIFTASLLGAIQNWTYASADEKPWLLQRPLSQQRMAEIYDAAFYASLCRYGSGTDRAHKDAMGAVDTAASRYNQLDRAIAKYDQD